MSGRFEVGDMVEAIDDDAGTLVVGGLYTVSEVFECSPKQRHWRRFLGLALPFGPRCGSVQNLDVAETPPDPDWVHCGCCFRKVRRPRSEFLAELLKVPIAGPVRAEYAPALSISRTWRP